MKKQGMGREETQREKYIPPKGNSYSLRALFRITCIALWKYLFHLVNILRLSMIDNAVGMKLYSTGSGRNDLALQN